MTPDPYEREAAKAAIHTLQREIKTLRERVKELDEITLDWFITAQEIKGHCETLACHVLHYAAMPHAHPDAAKDAANARAAMAKSNLNPPTP